MYTYQFRDEGWNFIAMVANLLHICICERRAFCISGGGVGGDAHVQRQSDVPWTVADETKQVDHSARMAVANT